MLTVYTARITYTGPDRLDITRKGNDPIGVAFAPTWAILEPALDAGVEAKLIQEAAHAGGYDRSLAAHDVRSMLEDSWSTYVDAYTGEMRVSAGMDEKNPRFGFFERRAVARGCRPRPEAWASVRARCQVVLCCFCTEPTRCHRRLLAGFLVKRGAEDGGELIQRGRCEVDGCGRLLFVVPSGLVCDQGHGQ